MTFRAIDFSPSGDTFATGGDDGTIRIWRTTDGSPLLTLQAHQGAVLELSYGPDSTRLASISSDASPFGIYHALLRTGNGYMERSVDLSGQSGVMLSFASKVVAFEDSDDFTLLLSDDGLHPNSLGYNLMAEEWFEGLLEAF